jgi:4-amino-4-deoxy-L-arabinose transferase-like glycosyltransferase
LFADSRRSVKCLTGLLLLYLLLVLAYWLATPVYEGPDEPMHYAYVRHLVETGRLPPLTGYEGGHPAHQETSQPPLYHVTAALLTFWAPDQGDYGTLLERNPNFAYPAPPTVPDNKNTWLHTSAEDFPWRGTVLSIRLTRLVSVLFDALGIVTTWGLGRELWPSSDWLPLLAAGLTLCIPQFLFMSSVVSNDTAAMALSACVLWAAVRMARRTAEVRRVLLLGLLLGLAMLTKLSALGLIPLVGLFLVVVARRECVSWQAILSRLGLVLSVAALVAGWWYVRNWVLYGNPFNTQVHLTSPWAWNGPLPLQEALAHLDGVERSFWGMFGTGSVGLSDGVYLVLRMGWLLALIGWGSLLRRHPHRGAMLWMWGMLWTWCLLILALQVRWMQLVLAPWGRLLFPALSAIACLLVEGWRGWLRPHARPVPILVLVVGLLLLSGAVPLAVIHPAYARPPQLTPDQVVARALPTDFRMGELARLIGYDLNRTSLSPDDWLTVTLCWEVVEPTTTDYTLFVQLIDMDGGLAASRHTYPGQGRFQTSRWQPGDRFCDETRVYVGEHILTPAVYQVEVGLLEATSGDRLPVRTAGVPLDGPLFLARARVVPDVLSEVVAPVPLGYHLGGTLMLEGCEPLPQVVRTGQPISLTVYWRATSAPPTDYITFVHLLDPTGNLAAQIDRPPREGHYPTSFWVPGEVVSDTLTLRVPVTAAPDIYRLVGGMYTWPDLARLPVVGPDGQAQSGQLVELGRVIVR